MRRTHNNKYNMVRMLLLLGLQLVSWQEIWALSDQRLCADPKCSKIISMGVTKITYSPIESGMLGFRAGMPVRIYSKSAGTDPDVWGIEVSGRRGYANKDHIKEMRVLINRSEVTHIVPTNLENAKKPPNELVKSSEVTEEETSTTAPLSAVTPLVKASTLEVVNTTPVQETLPVEVINETKDENKEVEKTDYQDVQTNNINIEKTAVTEPGFAYDFNEQLEDDVTTLATPVVAKNNQLESEQQENIKAEPLNEKEQSEKVKEDLLKSAEITEIVDETAENELKEENKNNEQLQNTVETKNISFDEEINTPKNIAMATDVPLQLQGKINTDMAKEVPLPQEENSTADPLTPTDESQDLKLQQSQGEKVADMVNVVPFPEQENITAERKIQVDAAKDVELQKQQQTNIMTEYKDLPLQQNSAAELFREKVQPDDLQQIKPELNIDKSEPLQQENATNELPKETVDALLELENTTADIPKETPEPKNLPLQQEQISPELDVPADGKLDQQENAMAEMPKEALEIENLPQQQQQKSTELEAPMVGQVDKQENVTQELPKQTVDVVLEQEQLENTTAEIPIEALEPKNLPHQQQQKSSELDTSIVGTVDQQENVTQELPQNTLDINDMSIQQQHEKAEKPSIDILENKSENIVAQLPQVENVQLENEQLGETSSSVKVDETNYQQQDKISEVISNSEIQQKVVDVPTLFKPVDEIQVPRYEVPVEPFVDTETMIDLPAEQYLPLKTENHNYNDPNEYYRKLQEATNIPQPAQAIDSLEINHSEYQEVETNSLPTLPQQELQQEQTIDVTNNFDEQQQTEQSVLSKDDPLALPSKTPTTIFGEEESKENGLFATILGTVNSFWSSGKKDAAYIDTSGEVMPSDAETQYCNKLLSNDCPAASEEKMQQQKTTGDCYCSNQEFMSLEKFTDLAAEKLLQMSDLLACLVICAATSLVFLFGYYCFCNSSREGALLAKLNHLERSLLAAQKENAILKHDISQTRQKLSSIEDNSFGSNDMVIALKRELEEELQEKEKLQQQVHTLEKELENAAEAGLELNKIVSDLLSNQTGDESIISSVEELQRQLNEQQNTILEINANLADKSRENSELQLMLAEQNARLSGEIASLQQDNDELEAEKSNLQTRLQELKNEFDEDITKALEAKNFEIKRLQNEILELQRKCETEHTKWQTSLAKVEALEECLKSLKKNPSVNIAEVINVANARAEVLDLQKRSASLKERLDAEQESKRLAEDKLKFAAEEVDKFKADFHQCERDKLEAQTRLEVLSNYFKEKETQLQKELSVKEAMWLKQQGETTSTVDRLTAMQEEINFLKSQNDSLRAEIEAQVAAHKAQIGTLENRAHETWLAARQSERRLEEARAEASALRRKLTINANDAGRVATDGKVGNELNMAPSPIHMELPPPGFLPLPPFLGPPPPFMGLPPQSFVPPGELRPAPLGRIMSPPPPAGSGRHGMRAAYTPPEHRSHDYDHAYYDDDDDDYDDDLDEQQHRRRRYSRGSDSWPRHRGDYSPPSPKYRSHSPEDSRYSYTTDRDLISTYDTETDFSPPPSPRDRRARGSRSGSYKAYSPPPPTASSPINDTSSGKKAASSTANKEFAAINISRIEPYHSSSESNNERRYKKGGSSGNDSSERYKKTQNGRHGKSLV